MNPRKLSTRKAASRRQMLVGRGIGRLLRDPLAAAIDDSRVTSGYYLIVGRSAMACQFQVFLRPEDRVFLPTVHAALDEIDLLEKQMTVYRDDSELSLLNRSAHASPVRVEKRLFRLLEFARAIGGDTHGAFDITAGPLIRCWGFYDRRGRIPLPDELSAARESTGWENVVFDRSKHSVSFVKKGVELNLGSIGKGYALDRAVDRLRKEGLMDFMIHAGHSSIFASGNSNSSPGWEVAVRHPIEAGRSLGTLRLRNQGMSTSGSREQFFLLNGKRVGHVLDPRTGEPCMRTALCSVLAPSAALAEALSTAFFVMTPEEVGSYCGSHPEVGSIVVAAQGDTVDAKPLTWGITLRPPEVLS